MSRRLSATLSLLSVAVLYAAFRIAGESPWPFLSHEWGEGLLKVAIWVIPSIAVVSLAWRLNVADALRELGLWSNPLLGYAFGFVSALPMLAAWPGAISRPITWSSIVGSVLLGPLAEEVLFRGLLFRQLYRRAGRPLVRAMIISALAFGFAHLANVDFGAVHLGVPASVTPVAGEVGLTALGGLLFAWIVYRWDSLWPAIGLHTTLNLSWEMTGGEVGSTPHVVTLTRLASVVVALAVTWQLTKKTDHSQLTTNN